MSLPPPSWFPIFLLPSLLLVEPYRAGTWDLGPGASDHTDHLSRVPSPVPRPERAPSHRVSYPTNVRPLDRDNLPLGICTCCFHLLLPLLSDRSSPRCRPIRSSPCRRPPPGMTPPTDMFPFAPVGPPPRGLCTSAGCAGFHVARGRRCTWVGSPSNTRRRRAAGILAIFVSFVMLS